MMKKCNRTIGMFFMVCLAVISVLCFQDMTFAKKATTDQKIKNLAKKQVKGGSIVEMDKDYKNGVLVYEIQILKGKKEYDLTYRASDSKLISYSWEIQSWYVKKGKGKIISSSKCKKLAGKQISNGKIISIVKTRSDDVDIYKVKAQKGNKKYELKFHARTGKLLEYEWELTTKKNSSNNYISGDQAKY